MDRHLWPVVGAASKEALQPLVKLLNDKSLNWEPEKSWSLKDLRRQVHDELLLNGGNSFSNAIREKGPPWSEIVRDVADRVKVKPAARDSVQRIEERVAFAILQRAIDKMKPRQMARLQRHLEQAGLPKDVPLKKGGLLVLMTAAHFGGFASYQLLMIVANAVAKALLHHGLSLATNAALAKILGVLLGPVGWAAAAALTAVGLGGPAYRITVQSVVLIAVLRAQQASKSTRPRRRSMQRLPSLEPTPLLH